MAVKDNTPVDLTPTDDFLLDATMGMSYFYLKTYYYYLYFQVKSDVSTAWYQAVRDGYRTWNIWEIQGKKIQWNKNNFHFVAKQ